MRNDAWLAEYDATVKEMASPVNRYRKRQASIRELSPKPPPKPSPIRPCPGTNAEWLAEYGARMGESG